MAPVKQAEEKRAALVNLLEAEAEHMVVVRLFASDAPAQVDVHQVNATGFQSLPQCRKDALHQPVSRRLHVAEG